MSRILVNELGARTGTDISIKSGSTLGGADSQLKITGGSSGQVLTTNGLGVLTWTTIGVLPTQSGQAGKFLKTDGSTASWDTVDSLPTQTGNENKFLTTDGTTEEWGPNTGKGYNNWNNVAVNVTTTVPADENAVVFGPITVTSPAVWTVNGPGILRVI